MSAKIIPIFKNKKIQQSWVEAMTYTELLAERRFLRSEILRIKRAHTSACKVDPRGMWIPEIRVALKVFEDLIDGCEFVINMVQKEMIKRNLK